MNIIVLALILLSDQLIKGLIRSYPVGRRLFVFSPVAEIVHCTNTGAAFSIMSDATHLIALLSLFLLCAILVVMTRYIHLTRPARTALACLLGGGIGNLIDRLIYGGVTDYIHLLFIDFPVFNLADIAITLSVSALLYLMITKRLETE